MLGFINLDKPAGLTSHDCVAKVRRLLNIKRVGHGGTLDPAATGVLPIAIGPATRLLSYLPEQKAYRAKIRFGIQTTTDDLEGEVIESQSTANLNLAEISAYLDNFIGDIEQIPPAYSAIQKDGKRLYTLAREGKTVEAPVRNVQIYQIKMLAWYPGEFPELLLEISCGPGTYIRAIARDLGVALKVGATLAALRRTESCGMKIGESLTLEQLFEQQQKGKFMATTPEKALQNIPKIILDDVKAKRWCQGQKIPVLSTQQEWLQVHSAQNQCLGIAQVLQGDNGAILKPKVVLNQSFS